MLPVAAFQAKNLIERRFSLQFLFRSFILINPVIIGFISLLFRDRLLREWVFQRDGIVRNRQQRCMLLAVRHRIWSRLATLVVLVIGAGLSVIGWTLLRSHYERVLSEQFKAEAQLWLRAVRERLSDNPFAARVFCRSFPGLGTSHAEEFASFAQGILRRGKERLAVCWIPKVLDRERTTHEESSQAELQKFYEICRWDEGGKPRRSEFSADYFPLAYLEPAASVALPLGLDLGSIPAVRKKLFVSAEDGEPFGLRMCLLVPEACSLPPRPDIGNSALAGVPS